MSDKIRTESDRRAPKPVPAPGTSLVRQGAGQKSSQERGSHTRSKKNSGKRPSQGG